ncbi:lysophospholipid acyltransferase family protein [Desulfoplanes sp.]
MRDLIYTAIGAAFSRMSPSGVERFGRGVGRLFWHLLPARRAMAISTIRERLQVSRGQARDIARASFTHAAQAFGEIFLTRQMDPAFMRDHIEISATVRNRLDRVFSQNRPVVVVTGHMGSWELLGGLCRLIVPETPCQVVVRLPKDKALAELMLRLRSVGHLQVLAHRNAARNVLRCLKKNGMTAFLVDHNCSRDEAVFLPFLGRMAAVNMGPALLALRSKALVLPVFLLRKKGTMYRLAVEESLDTATLEGTRDENIRAIADFYTRAVERVVQKYPEQWFWMHKRWKTRPESH